MSNLKASTATPATVLAGTDRLIGAQGGVDAVFPLSSVATFVAAYMAGAAPATLNEISELAAAIDSDPNFAVTMAAALAGKQPQDADLTAIAALTTTIWGRDLLTLANAASMRSLLGCGHIVDQSAIETSVTGTTTQTTLATWTVPGNSLGPNGSFDILMVPGYTSSGNAKYIRIKINGTLVLSLTPTTTASGQYFFSIANRGTTNSQVANATGLTGFGSASGPEQSFSFDTTSDMTVTITGELSNISEVIRLARWRCISYFDA